MLGRIVFLAAIALSACGQPRSGPTSGQSKAAAAPPRLPFDHRAGILDGYRVRVSRHGEVTWNGVAVSNATLTAYIDEVAGRSQDARLWVEFEPGVRQDRADWVRHQIIDSGLCRQRRCAEVGWNVQRPVVN